MITDKTESPSNSVLWGLKCSTSSAIQALIENARGLMRQALFESVEDASVQNAVPEEFDSIPAPVGGAALEDRRRGYTSSSADGRWQRPENGPA